MNELADFLGGGRTWGRSVFALLNDSMKRDVLLFLAAAALGAASQAAQAESRLSPTNGLAPTTNSHLLAEWFAPGGEPVWYPPNHFPPGYVPPPGYEPIAEPTRRAARPVSAQSDAAPADASLVPVAPTAPAYPLLTPLTPLTPSTTTEAAPPGATRSDPLRAPDQTVPTRPPNYSITNPLNQAEPNPFDQPRNNVAPSGLIPGQPIPGDPAGRSAPAHSVPGARSTPGAPATPSAPSAPRGPVGK